MLNDELGVDLCYFDGCFIRFARWVELVRLVVAWYASGYESFTPIILSLCLLNLALVGLSLAEISAVAVAAIIVYSVIGQVD